ncbi:MAG: hypothetical protein AB1410_05405 [Acidobacteriota bacterium]
MRTMIIISAIAVLMFSLSSCIIITGDLSRDYREQKPRNFYFRVGPEHNEREVFSFIVRYPNRIEIEATWSGSADELALILDGPGREAFYAKKEGRSPLHISLNVDDYILRQGKIWKVSVVNFKKSGWAEGRIRVKFL